MTEAVARGSPAPAPPHHHPCGRAGPQLLRRGACLREAADATQEDVWSPVGGLGLAGTWGIQQRATFASFQCRFLAVPPASSEADTEPVPTDTGKQDDWPCLHGAPILMGDRPQMAIPRSTS